MSADAAGAGGRATSTSPAGSIHAITAPVDRVARGRTAASRSPSVDLTEAVTAAQAGDEAAFMYLYRSITPPLLRFLRVLVGEEAEDVASETWAQVCRDLARFHGDGDGFRGWVATIGRNRALDHLRSRRRRPTEYLPPDALPDLPGQYDTAEQAMEAVSTSDAIALIAALPPDQAEAVLLRAVMGLDAKGAGRVLGKRPGAVRTSAYRGLKTLAARLDAPPP